MNSTQRRAAIVHAAIRLFAEKGFRGTTTRELAAAAGVTEPVLYRHFHSKRGIYSAIIESRAREVSKSAAGLLEAAKARDDRAFFLGLGALILKRYQKEPELSRLLLYSCLERHELSEMVFERLTQDLHRLVSGYIRRRVREGAFRKVEPAMAARGLIGMIAYHGLVGILFPGRFGRPASRRVVEQMVGIFLAGVAAET